MFILRLSVALVSWNYLDILKPKLESVYKDYVVHKRITTLCMWSSSIVQRHVIVCFLMQAHLNISYNNYASIYNSLNYLPHNDVMSFFFVSRLGQTPL